MTEPNNIAIQNEPNVTRAHRERAASALHEIGNQVYTWIETGQVNPKGGPLNDQLVDVAEAFSAFEHEILLCPSTVVHSMEESSEVCSNCGTTSEDFHTIRECFARYKQAQDAAADQVTHYLQERLDLRERELQSLYASGAVHVCVTIGGPDCTHCPICGKELPTEPELHVFWDGDSVWVVARDADDAALVYAEHIGEDVSDVGLEFERVSDEEQIAIRVWVSGPHKGEIAPADEQDGTDAIAPRMESARFWVETQGRGFLCTTDY